MTTQDMQSLKLIVTKLIVTSLVLGQFVAVVGSHGIACISGKAISMQDRSALSNNLRTKR